MTFKRLDDNTIRCIVSEQDMADYGLKLEDFFTNKDKARNFLETVVKQAQEIVGYETSGDTLAMQVMPLPQNNLAITFSEKAQDNIHDMLGHIRSAMEEIKNGDLLGLMKPAQTISDDCEIYEDEKKEKKKKKKGKKTFFRVYQFRSYEDIEHFCATIPEEHSVKSQLYKDITTNNYYLCIEKGRLSIKTLEAVCFRATEFSNCVSTQENYMEYCKEHYMCIMKKNAVKHIMKLICK